MSLLYLFLREFAENYQWGRCFEFFLHRLIFSQIICKNAIVVRALIQQRVRYFLACFLEKLLFSFLKHFTFTYFPKLILQVLFALAFPFQLFPTLLLHVNISNIDRCSGKYILLLGQTDRCFVTLIKLPFEPRLNFPRISFCHRWWVLPWLTYLDI